MEELEELRRDAAATEPYPYLTTRPLVVSRGAATSAAEPISLGIPFPRGILRDEGRLRLSDPSGTRVPLQASASLVAYLNNRPEIYEFPLDEHYADGVAPRAADVNLIVMDLNDRLTQRAIGLKGGNPMRSDPPPTLMVPAHKVVLVMRHAPAPTVPADPGALFGDAIGLEGYDLARDGDGLALTLHWRS